MKLWVGVTDADWYNRLRQLVPDEVNFWQPSGSRFFRVLQAGELFLFKLHAPQNFIVGGGYFVRYSALPLSLAWDVFGEKNGVASFDEFLSRIRRYRHNDDALDPVIGCNVLAEPFFLERPACDTQTTDGRSIWESIQEARAKTPRVAEPSTDDATPNRFGAEYLARGRLGQRAFRVLVIDAYERKCAVTGEKTLPVLEAAHIKPYSLDGPHRLSNGILLRSDLHKLFDLGCVTVTPQLRLEVSPRLKADWNNGKEYYAHHGVPLHFSPTDPSSRPNPEFLQWHNENRFKA